MTAANTQTAHDRRRASRVHFSDLLRSEWIKITSIPAMLIGLASIVLLSIGLPALVASWTGQRGLEHYAVDQTVYGLVSFAATFTTVIAGLLGVLVTGHEYSTGTIRTTLLAAPRRWGVLGAKALVMFVLTSVLTLVSVFTAWAVTYPVFDAAHQAVGLTTPGVLMALLGSAFSVGCCAVVGVGLAAVARSTTAAAILVTAVTLGAVVVAQLLPESTAAGIMSTLVLGPVAYRTVEIRPEGAFLDIASGEMSVAATWLVLLAWQLGTLALGWIVLARKDA